MKDFIKKFTPKFVLYLYHWCLAQLGAFFYKYPSRRMIVIGVTGTKGKSTVVNLISRVLSGAGYSTGIISTINFKIAKKEWPNETKQTMPGRFKLQKILSQMAKACCQYAIIETSSEGIAQYRHLGIDYDVAVFTNLSPEHIESHGSYKKYRQAKIKLFSSLKKAKRKNLNGHDVKKVMIANRDDKEAEHFLFFPADIKYTYGLNEPGSLIVHDQPIIAEKVELSDQGIAFSIEGRPFKLKLLGEFNVYNALAAICVGLSQQINIDQMQKSLAEVQLMPGRLEEIKNNRDFRVFVDYAHEPASLESAYQAIQVLKPRKIISVLGSQGGGRDKAKRPLLGALAAQYTDHVIVTNEDPYDEDPEQIIDDVIKGATQAQGNPPIEKIVDRREAIKKALSLAGSGDIVIITGKGSETVMAVTNNRKVPWDDRRAVKELINLN